MSVGYSNKPRHEERQRQAKERQAAYAKLTLAQKLVKLNNGKFAARKQRARLARGT